MKRGAKFLGVATFLLLVPLGLYLAFNAWDRNRLRAFCADMRPGTSIDGIRDSAAEHGIDAKWINDVGLAGPNGNIVVLAPSEMGEMTCNVEINGGTVSAAEVYGP